MLKFNHKPVMVVKCFCVLGSATAHLPGVAMGLLLDDALEEPVILTDILGLEDAFGTMDFKVCGDDKGITSFQLDIKCDGLTFPVLEKALAQVSTRCCTVAGSNKGHA